MKSGIAGSRSYFVQVYELVERVSQLPNLSVLEVYQIEGQTDNWLRLVQSNQYG